MRELPCALASVTLRGEGELCLSPPPPRPTSLLSPPRLLSAPSHSSFSDRHPLLPRRHQWLGRGAGGAEREHGTGRRSDWCRHRWAKSVHDDRTPRKCSLCVQPGGGVGQKAPEAQAGWGEKRGRLILSSWGIFRPWSSWLCLPTSGPRVPSAGPLLPAVPFRVLGLARGDSQLADRPLPPLYPSGGKERWIT